jgi:recombinational DNA repair protein (RecF pathway)
MADLLPSSIINDLLDEKNQVDERLYLQDLLERLTPLVQQLRAARFVIQFYSQYWAEGPAKAQDWLDANPELG